MNKALVLCLCLAWVALPLAAAEKPGTAARADQAVRKKLTSPVISGTLADAMQRLEELSGAKVVVSWRVLATCGVTRNQAISVKASQATVGQMLDLILTQASKEANPLAWYADEDAIYVTSQRQALDRRLRLSPLARPPIAAARTPATVSRRAPSVESSMAPPSEGLNFEDVPLKDVVEYLRQRSGLSFHVNWRALAVAGIDRETAVTLKVRDITMRRALDLLVDQLGATQDRETRVYWLVDNGVVTITTGASLNTGVRVRVIDVADLLLIVPNFRGPRIDFSMENQDRTGSGDTWSGGGGRGGGLFDEEELRGGARGGENRGDRSEENIREMRERVRNTLIEIIKESIGEEMWHPTGKGNVRLLHDKLIISQTRLGFLLLAKAGILR